MTFTVGKKLGFAGIGACVLLVTAVLPAEYGLDPTGIGSALGLTALAEGVSDGPAKFDSVMEFNIEEYDPSADQIEQSVKGLITLADAPFKSEVLEIQIEDLGEVEHKFIMNADDSFVYSWEVVGAEGDGVYYDFHGHPSTADAADYPEGFEMAYSKSEGVAQAGSFTAPFPGYHGFYFMNLEEGPITVRLTIAGFWDEDKEMYRAVDGDVLTAVEF